MLEVRSLEKRYGAQHAVRDFSHRFADGKITTILGPSGSGKSTALALIAGLKQPDRGTVHLDGRDITAVPPERRDFGMVFQNYSLFPHLSVQKNVEFGLRVRGAAAVERSARARETIIWPKDASQKYPAANNSASRWRARLRFGRRCF